MPQKISVTIINDDRETALSQGADELGVAVEEVVIEAAGEGRYTVTLKEIPGTFEVQVTPDKMTAVLVEITPPPDTALPVKPTDILNALAEKKVTFGIDEELVHQVCAEVESTKKPRQNVIIAVGKPAQKGENARVDFKVGDKAENQDPEISYIVRPGMVLAVKTPVGQGEAGKNVLGDELPAKPAIDYPFSAGANVTLAPDGVTYEAAIYGRAMPKRDTIAVFNLVEISEDAMSATMDIYPVVADNSRLTLEDVRSSLKEAGVTHGIKEEAINAALLQDTPQRKIIVASGYPAKNGVDAQIDFGFRLNGTDPLTVDNARQQGELDPAAIVKELVIAGQQLAKKTPPVLAVDGYTVTGSPLAGRRSEDKDITAGEGVTLQPDGFTFVMADELAVGYADLVDGQLVVDDPLRVSADGMKVFLTIHPTLPGVRALTGELLLRLLKHHKIAHGVSKKAVQRALEHVAAQKKPLRDALIAKGTEPVRGEDAKIDFSVTFGSTAGSTAEKPDLINFRERSLLHNVKQGEVISSKIAAKPGIDGRDVFGNEIPAEPGEDKPLIAVENVTVSEDGLVYTAAIDGMVSLIDGNKIGVYKHYEIRGDVDYSTGNLDMDGTLDIKGWIKAGFTVKATGDILVGGGIEDATVSAGAHITVSGGIIGGEQGKIKSGGDINALYLEKAHLHANGTITIHNDIMRSKVFAASSINATSGKGRIRGGIISAVNGITANELGSEANIKTIIIAGTNIAAQRRLALIKKQTLDYRRQMAKMDTVLGRYAGQLKTAKLPPDVTRKLTLLAKKRRELVQGEGRLARLMQEVSQQMAKIDLKAVRVIAHKAVYIGTSIIIGGKVFKVTEDIKKPAIFGLNENGHVDLLEK